MKISQIVAETQLNEALSDSEIKEFLKIYFKIHNGQVLGAHQGIVKQADHFAPQIRNAMTGNQLHIGKAVHDIIDLGKPAPGPPPTDKPTDKTAPPGEDSDKNGDDPNKPDTPRAPLSLPAWAKKGFDLGDYATNFRYKGKPVDM